MRDKVLAKLGPGWTEIEVMPDLAGIPRVISARKKEPEVRGQKPDDACWLAQFTIYNLQGRIASVPGLIDRDRNDK
jgi:hypothetical protein